MLAFQILSVRLLKLFCIILLDLTESEKDTGRYTVHILLNGQNLYQPTCSITVCHPNFCLSYEKMNKLSVMVEFLSAWVLAIKWLFSHPSVPKSPENPRQSSSNAKQYFCLKGRPIEWASVLENVQSSFNSKFSWF